jgi:hypothetical protein
MDLKEFKLTYKRDTCTPKSITALFTIAKLWNKSRYTTDGWIKKRWIILLLNGVFLSHKENVVHVFLCRKMGGTGDHHVT